MVCCDELRYQDEINQVLIHELIHAYDDCIVKNLDWKNCAHHACSEIRANHLSGDCHYKRELLRGFMKIRGISKSVLKGGLCSLSGTTHAAQRQLQKMQLRLCGIYSSMIHAHLIGLHDIIGNISRSHELRLCTHSRDNFVPLQSIVVKQTVTRKARTFFARAKLY